MDNPVFATWNSFYMHRHKHKAWIDSIFDNDLSIDNVMVAPINNAEFEELKGYDSPSWQFSESEIEYLTANSGLFRFDHVNLEALEKGISWYMWPTGRGVVDTDHICIGNRAEKNLSLAQIDILRDLGSQAHVHWKIGS